MNSRAPRLSRTEAISLERFSLGWPWHNARNAAALARELIQWAMPQVMWAEPDDPRVAVIDAHNRAEIPVGGDPYREPGKLRVNADPVEVSEARFDILNILGMLKQYIDGEPVRVPQDFGTFNDHPMTRLYWYATEAGKRAFTSSDHAAVTVNSMAQHALLESASRATTLSLVDDSARWRAVGRAAQIACEFLRKHVTNNPTVGMIDGAGGAVLHNISCALVGAGKPTEEITGRMFHWRVKDALKGKELSPELDANLRPAFEAAWSAAEYDFAYSLLADIDQLTER